MSHPPKIINIPCFNEELAEFLGILSGDGHLSLQKRNKNFSIVGHSRDDLYYLKNHVTSLIKSLFGSNLNVLNLKYKNRNAFMIYAYSTLIIDFLNNLGMPQKKTKEFRILDIIRKSKLNLKLAFLRGLADTDFAIVFKKGSTRIKHSYPVISTCFASRPLVEDIKEILSEIEIKANIYIRKVNYNGRKDFLYQIDVYGRKNLQKWMEHIGFNNKKHLDKIKFWEKNGYYSPQYFPKQKNL